MARITNEKLFNETPCVCFPIDESKPYTPDNIYCYSEGAIGMLSNEQDKLCKRQIIIPMPPGLEFHLDKFPIATRKIMAPCMKETTEEDYYSCMYKQAEELVEKKPVAKKIVAKKPKIERRKPPIPVKEEVEPEWKPEVRVVGRPKFEKGKLVTPVKPKKKK